MITIDKTLECKDHIQLLPHLFDFYYELMKMPTISRIHPIHARVSYRIRIKSPG